MNLNEIQDLIKFVAKAGVTEVEIEQKDFKITIKSDMPNKKGRKQEMEAQIMPVQMPVQGMPAMAMPAAPVPQPVAAAPAAAPAAAEPAAAEENSNYITIKSPMIGTFYRSANPESPAFVNVGDKISAGQTVCIVEAMKLINELPSEIEAEIVEICIKYGEGVSFGQVIAKVT